MPPASGCAAGSESVGECASKAEPGEWINGGNWVAAAFVPIPLRRPVADGLR